MFAYALRHPLRSANPEVANHAELTSLTLSCKLGRDVLFKEMLELSCKEFWRYSNVCCSGYPLGALDSIRPSGETNWGSAVMLILAGTKEEHLNMLEGGIIAKLLEEKWATFAMMMFYKKLAKLFLHLICLSVALYSRPRKERSLVNGMREGTEVTKDDVTRYIFEVASLLGTFEFFLVQNGEELKNAGVGSYFKSLRVAPPKFLYTVANLVLLVSIPFRFLQLGEEEQYYRRAEDAVVFLAIPFIWLYLLFFAGAIKLTGPFVTMVFSMITGDMTTFCLIYVIIMFGFTQAFYFMEKEVYAREDDENAEKYVSYGLTWVALFHMTLGEYGYSIVENSPYSAMAMVFFFFFQVIMPILLLNMLIAMMGNTYAIVSEKSEKEFLKQWARVIMSIERAVSVDQAKAYLEEYSMKMGENLRGVMVIKTKDKSRASQRKGAVANWKKTGKTVNKYLKKRRITGKE